MTPRQLLRSESSGLCEVDGKFSTVLLESIDEVLVNVLSERVKQTIYGCLVKQGVRKQQIPENLPAFDAFLENNFGKGGGVLGRKIAKRLYTQLGLQFVEVPQCTLTDYADMAFRRLSRQFVE